MRNGVVIVGAGQAGAQAAASLRQSGYAGPVTIVGEEAHPPYQRPPLSKAYLSGALARDRLLLRPREFYDANAIRLLTGSPVRAIDRAQRRVALESGESLAYDALMLATGAPPRRLACPGAALAGVHYLRTLDDSDRLRSILSVSGRIIIIGAGYVGLEVAAVARKAGRDVLVVEMAQRPLSRVAPAAISDFYERIHREAGVDFRFGAGVEAIIGRDGAAAAAALDTGEEIACGAILVGIGAAPSVALAVDAGLAVDNGVVVDEHARTSDPSIFAAGDCANFPSPRYGRRLRLESVPNAIEQAKVAAANIAGGSAVHDSLPWFWSDQYDVKLQTAGLGDGADSAIIRGDPATRAFSVWRMKDGAPLSVDAVNDPASFAAARRILPTGRAVDAAALADPAFDLRTL